MQEDNKEKGPLSLALSLAWELGYTIAVPLVVLVLFGRFLDKKFGSSPLFLLAGILLAVFISSWAVVFKTKKIMGEMDKKKTNDKDKK